MIIPNHYENLPCYIIGKGASILNLNSSFFENTQSPIICLYQATHKIESLNLKNPIYSLQKDGCKHSNGKRAWEFSPPKPAPMGHTCNNTFMFKPKNATVLLHDQESINCLPDYDKKIIFSLKDIGIPTNRPYYWLSFSLECAVKIAITWKCYPIKLLCFDSCVNGNTDCLEFNSDLSYTYRPSNSFDKIHYLQFCANVNYLLEKYPHEWIIP